MLLILFRWGSSASDFLYKNGKVYLYTNVLWYTSDMGTTQKVAAYLRVSTDEQADSGLGLEAQAASIAAEAEQRGWEIVATFTDEGVSGSVAPLDRPGLAAAVDLACANEASIIVAAKLDRFSRDTRHALDFNAHARVCNFNWFAVDSEDDTTTADGEFLFTLRMGLATRERKLIGERTKAALAAKKARGHRLGRPVTTPDEIRNRIAELRDSGLSWAKVAAQAEAEGLNRPTTGKPYGRSGCQKVYASIVLDREATAFSAS